MRKFNLYQNAGVKEYWIVDIEHRAIDVFVLEDGRYQYKGVYGIEDTPQSLNLPEFQLPVADICNRVVE